jgi:RNA polymerase sigma factor (sigma-70 family)
LSWWRDLRRGKYRHLTFALEHHLQIGAIDLSILRERRSNFYISVNRHSADAREAQATLYRRHAGVVPVRIDRQIKPPFEIVVEQHGATVLRVVCAVVGPIDADDAWSETFLAAMKAYPRLPPDANIEAWLVTIAHRKAIDVIRSAARRAVPVAETPDIPTRTDAHDLDLDAALAALPLKQRQAVAYHYLAGLPYAEIATLLGNSVPAARRAAADGIATLRRTYLLPDIDRKNAQ